MIFLSVLNSILWQGDIVMYVLLLGFGFTVIHKIIGGLSS